MNLGGRRLDMVKNTVGGGRWEVYTWWRMERFESVMRGNGVGREPIKYQPILVWETLQLQFLNKV